MAECNLPAASLNSAGAGLPKATLMWPGTPQPLPGMTLTLCVCTIHSTTALSSLQPAAIAGGDNLGIAYALHGISHARHVKKGHLLEALPRCRWRLHHTPLYPAFPEASVHLVLLPCGQHSMTAQQRTPFLCPAAQPGLHSHTHASCSRDAATNRHCKQPASLKIRFSSASSGLRN